jgi:hypothetical protein
LTGDQGKRNRPIRQLIAGSDHWLHILHFLFRGIPGRVRDLA